MATAKNYGTITKAITAFDACISGMYSESDASKKYGKTISKLINAEMTGERNGIDDYIMDTFHTFVQNKKEIKIDMEW